MPHETVTRETVDTAPRPALLLVDDDAELCKLMKEYFTRAGHSMECVYDGRSGLAAALSGKHDLVILDGMLPALDGLEVLRQLRKRSSVPVIMLTARTQGKDRIAGLDSGADDYLPKPFLPDELFARIRAVMRRYKNAPLVKSDQLTSGLLELNPVTHIVRYAGEDLDITDTEFQILEVLMRSPGRTVSRDEISTVLYQRESSPFERSLDVHISHLRKKLEQRGLPAIRTVRGVGYMFATEEKGSE
ncbi:response regulator transcription factor [Acidicapsa dinghuensis]|uniref:Response regulator transcription factor n=1 Tax=Acidicapsa dinghuensis TaxID=2218256 RepID=A0ABW1EJ75_9BACT|nr:response regulator transcription factor [Acidicapsa dinghuensis]